MRSIQEAVPAPTCLQEANEFPVFDLGEMREDRMEWVCRETK